MLSQKNCKENTNICKINDINILLIDDDDQNILIARSNGHFAFQVNSDVELADLFDYLNDQLNKTNSGDYENVYDETDLY
jgi:hypothetical protein